jgi:isoquinoline 1-oxidoreductase beta subunit
MSEHPIVNMSRRSFVHSAMATTAGAFVLSTQIKGSSVKLFTAMAAESGKGDSFQPNLFLTIPTSGTIELVCHRSEMGQGIRTGIPMLIAEELEIGLDQVKIVQAPGDEAYGDQNTDGSRSIRYNWERMRKFGATARDMLQTAAAKKWGVPKSECQASQGRITHSASGRSLTYQQLASTAAELDVPEDVPLKEPEDFRLIGKKTRSVDRKTMVTGQADYGMDIKRDGMVYAALQRSPTLGGSVKSFDAGKAKTMPGVITVESVTAMPQPINTKAAVAAIATNSWAAMEAAKTIKIEWQAGPHGDATDQSYRQKLARAGQKGKMTVARQDGKPHKTKAKHQVSHEFSSPFLVHAPMEPLVATAEPTKNGSMQIWAPTQDPQRLRAAAAKYLETDKENITVHVTFLGGGFGRKSQPDFGMEAVALAQKLNRPVKVVWSREDEVKHGFYHAAAWQKLSADLDSQGQLLSWQHDTIFPTVMSVFQPGAVKPQEFELGMGATNMPYRANEVTVRAGETDAPVRVAWLRSVCNVFHATAVNNFMDQLAKTVNQDPIEYRLQALGQPRKLDYQDTGRLIHVIKRCRDMAQWKQRRKQGAHLGFANHYSFQSYVAMVVEVEKDDDTIRVKQVDVVADCGQIVNPDAVIAQFQGGVIFGLSAALFGDIELKEGAVVQSNFDDYPVLRMNQTPVINVELVRNHLPPEGVGEPGTPPALPALVSAIESLTGQFITDLPIAKHVKV